MEKITARLTVKEVTHTQGDLRIAKLEYEGFGVPDDMTDEEYTRLDRIYGGFTFARETVIETEAKLEPGQELEISIQVVKAR